MSISKPDYDELDYQLACELMRDATLTSVALGDLVGLSSSAANERVRKLKSDGVVKKIVAHVDSRFMGMSLGAFIFVTVEGRENNASFLGQVFSHQNVLECHHVTGDYSYILKVRVADTKTLEDFISTFLKGHPGVIRTMTQIILSSSKDESVVVD